MPVGFDRSVKRFEGRIYGMGKERGERLPRLALRRGLTLAVVWAVVWRSAANEPRSI